MKYIYPLTQLQNHKTLLGKINSAATRLHKKVEVLDVLSLAISDYNKHYLGSYQRDILRVLQRSSLILCLSASLYERPLSDLVFVDYGGGTGFLALLAKELGVGTVIYSDIYDISCQDARVIADSLQLAANSYVCGDVGELLNFLQRERIHSDAIVSYDVLEHIYDVASFLRQLANSPNGPSAIFMASAANQRNPFIRRNLGKMHLRYEYQDRPKEPWHKERDTLRAFHSVRKEIIEQDAPDLNQKEVEVLAKNTRGKSIGDILACVEEYKKEKSFPVRPKHSTNTCDPYTGNWQEQLLEFDWLEGVLKGQGFMTSVLPGYYGTHAHKIKNLIGLGLNLFISKFPHVGLGVAPFYIFCGVRDRFKEAISRE